MSLQKSDLDVNLADLKEKSKAAASDAFDKASDAASQARAATVQMGSDLAESLRDGAERQKQAGADAVATLAKSARDAANELEDRSPQVAHLVRTSADAAERMSTNLRNQSLGDLVDATGNFATRHPMAFFGCGILAGFVVSRLLSPAQR